MQNSEHIEKESEEECRIKGNSEFSSKNYEKAVFWYSKGLEIAPNNVILMCNRAAVYLFQHKYQLAVEDASNSIEIDPLFIKAYYRKACALKELARFQEAIETIQKSLEIDPENSEFIDLKQEVSLEIQQNQILPCENSQRQKFDTLIHWLIDGGAYFPKIHIRYFAEDYRGVHSTRTIFNRECLLYVPKSHIITLEIAKSAEIGSQMMKNNVSLLSPKHSYLTSFILSEKNKPHSFWKPYIDILPESYSNFPIFFTDEEKEMLIGSPFLDQVNEKISDLQEDYKTICEAVSDFKNFSFEDFCKIRMAVSSRIFGMQIEGVTTDGFVPLADMLNHNKPKQTTWSYDEKRKGFVIEALESIPKGQEVFDSYGRKCNSRFFLNYGFILRNNDADEYPFLAKLDPSDYLFQLKKALLNGTSSFVFRVMKCVSDPSFYELLGFLRFSLTSDETFIASLMKEYRKNGSFEPTKIKSFSIENEIKVIKEIQAMAQEGLNKYYETIEEDLEILQRNDLTENQRNCVLMRLGEKNILKYFFKFSEEILPFIGKTLSEIQTLDIIDNYQEYIISSLGRIAQT